MIPFTLLWGGFVVFWLLAVSGIWGIFRNSSGALEYFGLIWGSALVLIGQYMIWGRFIHLRWRKQRTVYALTNRRALIVESGFRNRKSCSAFFAELSMLDKHVRPDGIGSISFGGPVIGQWRRRGIPPRPPTFDDVDQVDTVYQIAIRLRDQARKPEGAVLSR